MIEPNVSLSCHYVLCQSAINTQDYFQSFLVIVFKFQEVQKCDPFPFPAPSQVSCESPWSLPTFVLK